MYALIRLIPLYTYPYKLIAVIITALIVTVIALPIYCIYKLIISKVNEKTKKIFHRFLKIAGISILVLFFAELTVTLITEQHINKHLGFSYATPETPEGEP